MSLESENNDGGGKWSCWGEHVQNGRGGHIGQKFGLEVEVGQKKRSQCCCCAGNFA